MKRILLSVLALLSLIACAPIPTPIPGLLGPRALATAISSSIPLGIAGHLPQRAVLGSAISANAACVNAGVPSAPWLRRCDSTATTKWGLTALSFSRERDNPEIHVLVLNEDGSPASGIKVLLDTGVPEDIGFELTRAGSVDFLETGDSSFHNELGESGPYCVYVDGASDRSCGMGLLFPRQHNSTYYVTFRYTRGALPPTATPHPAATWTPVPGQTATPLPGEKCDVLPISGVRICAP